MSLTNLLSQKKGLENNSKLDKLFSAPAFKISATQEDDND